MPGLNTVYSELQNQGFRFLAVNILGEADESNIETMLEEHPEYNFPILLDHSPWIRDTYGVIAAPVNLLIDKTGVIRYREGVIEEDALRSWVEELISE